MLDSSMNEGCADDSRSGREQLAPMNLDTLARLRELHHSGCLACTNPRFRLQFECEQEELVARFRPEPELCSYENVLHGGVIGLLFDEAMTCLLMAHGVVGMTGELILRYREPVAVDEPIEIRSRVTRPFAPLYHIESTLIQSGSTKAKARARFVRREEEDQ